MWDLKIRSLKSFWFVRRGGEEESRECSGASFVASLWCPHPSTACIHSNQSSRCSESIGMDLDVDPTLVLLIVSGGLLSLAIVLWLLRSDADQKSKLGQWWTNGSSSLSEKILRFPPKAESAWVCSCQVEIF